jgi:hypothetical protein
MRNLQRGDEITADWLNELAREVRRNRVTPGHGLVGANTPGGTVISAAPADRTAARSSPRPAEPWDVNFVRETPGDHETPWMAHIENPVYVRGPVTKTVTVADAQMTAPGSPAYIGVQVNLEDGSASLLIAETIAGVTHASLPEDGTHIRRLLYLAQSTWDACRVDVDYRKIPELGVYA